MTRLIFLVATLVASSSGLAASPASWTLSSQSEHQLAIQSHNAVAETESLLWAWFHAIEQSFFSIIGLSTDLPKLDDVVAPVPVDTPTPQHALESCQNTPNSRHCWGEYNTSTNYYNIIPETGRTVEIWLSVEESICNQDGYKRSCLTFNGTMPGPAVVANWGDWLKIHVTNNLSSNGTAVHWHGIRMLNNVQNDGVPGVTQCAIAPGQTMTYKFQATQYGTSWYHSHFSLQYADGLFGPMIIHGPATADYDEDLGPLILQDWSHMPIFTAWSKRQAWGITHSLDNLLINGTNTFDCAGSGDRNCVGGGKKFETVFEHGKKYLLRLINVATDSQFQFSIDGHPLKVIATDFVPIHPYVTDSIVINSGQRYDVIIEADEEPGDYWIRGGWIDSEICQGVANDHPEDMTGIVRYNMSSGRTPSTTSSVQLPKVCMDMPKGNLIPFVEYDVTNVAGMTIEALNYRFTHTGMLKWTINTTDLLIDWANPTLKQIFDNETVFPENYNVVNVEKKTLAVDEWAVLVIENTAGSIFKGISHPIHLHGHDFWILAQEPFKIWDGSTESFQLKDAARRDTAILPKAGYLAIAFKLDNPGAWLVHCHIAWHASMGLSFEFVESRGSISVKESDRREFDDTCKAWSRWWDGSAPWPQEDSGI
ncbi:multicopper oxidase [Nemania sp. FL0916]|nr:multicopper oxidase [Nemania sp. FL0916]